MCFYQCGGHLRLRMNVLILVWQLLLVVMMMQKNLALEPLGVFWNSSLPPPASFPIVVAPLLLALASLPLCTDEPMRVFLLVKPCCSQDIVFFPLRAGGSNIAFSFWHQSLTRIGEYQRSFNVGLALFCYHDDRTASPVELKSIHTTGATVTFDALMQFQICHYSFASALCIEWELRIYRPLALVDALRFLLGHDNAYCASVSVPLVLLCADAQFASCCMPIYSTCAS